MGPEQIEFSCHIINHYKRLEYESYDSLLNALQSYQLDLAVMNRDIVGVRLPEFGNSGIYNQVAIVNEIEATFPISILVPIRVKCDTSNVHGGKITLI